MNKSPSGKPGAVHHVKRYAVHRGVNPEPVAQPLRAAVRRVRDPGLDHDALDDLPDPHPAQVPDRRSRLFAGLLRLPDAMGGGQSIEKLRRDRDGPEHDLGAAGGVLAFLETADGDGATGKVDPRRGDLQELGRAAPGPVQGFAEGPVAGGLTPGRRKEGPALLSVEIEPPSSSTKSISV